MATRDAVAAVGEREPWVQLTDARWLCDMPIRPLRSGASFIALTDPDRRHLIIADFEGEVSCGQVQASLAVGTLGNMRSRMLTRLQEHGLRLPEAKTRVLHLCTYCGAGNSRTGVIVCSLLVAIGLGLFPLVLLLRRQAEKEAVAPPSEEKRRWDIRAAGLLLMTAGLLLGWLGRGWVFWPGAPVWLLGGVAAFMGLFMALFPGHRQVQERVGAMEKSISSAASKPR